MVLYIQVVRTSTECTSNRSLQDCSSVYISIWLNSIWIVYRLERNKNTTEINPFKNWFNLFPITTWLVLIQDNKWLSSMQANIWSSSNQYKTRFISYRGVTGFSVNQVKSYFVSTNIDNDGLKKKASMAKLNYTVGMQWKC